MLSGMEVEVVRSRRLIEEGGIVYDNWIYNFAINFYLFFLLSILVHFFLRTIKIVDLIHYICKNLIIFRKIQNKFN